jgi:hypothetical protein
MALTAIIPELPEPLLPDVLTLTRGMESESMRARVLWTLVPRLREHDERRQAPGAGPGLLGEARAQGRQLSSYSRRARVLGALAPALGDRVWAEALDAAAQVDHPGLRSYILELLAPELAELPPAVLYPLWERLLHRLARWPRADLRRALGALAPVIGALGGPAARLESARAIRDTAGTWP